MKIEGRKARWLIAFGFYLLKALGRTLRYQIDDRAGLVEKPVTENYIGALWHNRLLMFPLVLRRFFGNRHGTALISASRDGDLISDAVHRFDYDVVRGSSSKLGASALLQLSDVLAAGRDVVITPDGPRGPAYEIGPGIIFLAQKTGARVLPMNMEYELLAGEKLGPIHCSPALLQSARDYWRTRAGKIDIYAGRIRSRASALAKRDDVAG